MIAFITGKIVEKHPAGLVLEAGGIGYSIHMSGSGSDQAGKVGDTVKIYIHFHVREDGMKLYGFAREQERVLFRHLISISGIGPKVALGILSGMSVESFVTAVLNQDVSLLKSAPGVGKKTAERLVLELRDKIGGISVRPDSSGGTLPPMEAEAVAALISLGYREANAGAAVRTALQEGSCATVEDVIRAALRGL